MCPRLLAQVRCLRNSTLQMPFDGLGCRRPSSAVGPRLLKPTALRGLNPWQRRLLLDGRRPVPFFTAGDSSKLITIGVGEGRSRAAESKPFRMYFHQFFCLLRTYLQGCS
ncbi:unnamed protein product [Urochloa humidicola]